MDEEEFKDLEEKWKEVTKAFTRIQFALFEIDKIVSRERRKHVVNKEK